MPGIKSLLGLLGILMVVSEITIDARPAHEHNYSTLTKSKRDVLLWKRTAGRSRVSLVARAPKSGKGGPKSLLDAGPNGALGGLPGGLPGKSAELVGLGKEGGAPIGPLGGLPGKEAELGGLGKEGGAPIGPLGKGLLEDILGAALGQGLPGVGPDGVRPPPPPPPPGAGTASPVGTAPPPPPEAVKEEGKDVPKVSSGQDSEGKDGRAGGARSKVVANGEGGAKDAPGVSSGRGSEEKEVKSVTRRLSVKTGKADSRQLATEVLPAVGEGVPPPPPLSEPGIGKLGGKRGKELGAGGKVAREAALTLAQVSQLVDNTMQQMQGANASAADIKKGAEVASKLGAGESFLRQAQLASLSQDPASTQKSLGIIRDNAQLVTQGFEEITKNSEDKGKVKESLEKMGAARKQVLQANKELIQGISPQGAEGRVQNKKSVNELSLNDAGKKSIGEAQKNLAAQSKAVDDQVAIIGKEGTGAAEIAAAAQTALDQELAQQFPREVLASGASDAAAAMNALGSVRDREFPQVIGGLRFIAANSNNTQAVKSALSSVVEGRQLITEANQKLLELSGGAAADAKNGAANNEGAKDKQNQGKEAEEKNGKENKIQKEQLDKKNEQQVKENEQRDKKKEKQQGEKADQGKKEGEKVEKKETEGEPTVKKENKEDPTVKKDNEGAQEAETKKEGEQPAKKETEVATSQESEDKPSEAKKDEDQDKAQV
ncbi:hypothetical protein VP01_57g3 [Puccinia sorghi]|uniref:Uncharacterized protein n=1 Tax=Puccinia sorghi TaxID=27349 RepID=A0A0L6UIA1_9BASI|nr:hypothetical protein VP01_57g3 [Puccinia sorghi]